MPEILQPTLSGIKRAFNDETLAPNLLLLASWLFIPNMSLTRFQVDEMTISVDQSF